MRDLNKVMIIGRLGRDPEMRYTPAGHPRTKFSVATSRVWTTQDGEKRSETEWFNVVAWDRLAEICSQYLGKGHRVYIEGRMQTRRWEDPQGVKRRVTEIVAYEMLILSERREANGHGAELDEEHFDLAFHADEHGEVDDEYDDFPF